MTFILTKSTPIFNEVSGKNSSWSYDCSVYYVMRGLLVLGMFTPGTE